MAVQAHLYSGNCNLGLPTMCSLQDLSLLNNPLLGVDENAHLFAFQTTHQQQQQTHQFHHLSHGILSPSSSSSDHSFLRMANFPQALDAQMELQRQELECVLQLQNEKLRIALHEQRKQQLSVLMNSLEMKTLSLIRQKEEYLAEATKKGIELQERLRKVEMESQTWQRVARANEAMVMDLNNTLEEVRERQQSWIMANNNNHNINSNSSGAEDAESFCIVGGKNDMISSKTTLACKSCKAQSSCVLFLPCRHLCCCKSCEAFLGSCPVCESTKEASLEVFLV